MPPPALPTPDLARAAADSFLQDYGPGPGAPVVVVMAAFDEASSVAQVVSSIPGDVAGVPVECLVVDDGSTDATAAEAGAAGALVCRLPANLGQGRALRVGYDLATRRGAMVLATMDADGQFVAAELPRLVEPVLAGQADFVNGSRRLGRSDNHDAVRTAGVWFFGALVSLAAGARITDPANGFRAFRVEVAARVPQRQAQYQTAELLIGAVRCGFRVTEVPVTILPRAAGDSKKGGNLRYGYRFAKVVTTTWWRLRSVPAEHTKVLEPGGGGPP